jgi:hypothetical protein
MVKKTLKRNHHKKSSKSVKSVKSHKRNKSRRNKQRGGDDGRYVLPMAYFGQGNKGYCDNFKPLDGAVSQGIIHKNGKFAGPNLSPQLGGGCGCRKRRS